MNPLIDAAREAAQGGWLMAGMTVYFFVFFLIYAVWAWWPSNKQHMDDMASAPLDDSDARRPHLPAGGSR